ncbi:MAG: c-type cytochrome [Rickettsiella sp.]|nr:c-type cytochrome [Rickettsiella sp.]
MSTPKIILICFILLLSFSTYLHAEFSDQSFEAIEERIAPIGKVRIGKETLNQLSTYKIQAHLGKTIFEKHCIICHSTGIAGAPRFGNKLDWQLRIKKKLSLLLEHVKNGYNAMPRKGTCLECSAEDLKAAIFYMTKKSA